VECNGCSGGDANPDRILLLDDAAAAHGGSWSLYLPAAAAANYQGGSLTFRSCAGAKTQSCTLTNYDELYFRAWVKLAADHERVHHFLSIGGTRPDAFWESEGNAGCRPNGYRAAGTTLDFDTDHEFFFYTYFPDMNCDSGGYCDGSYAQDICDGCATKDMPCNNGLECCWGNSSRPDPPVVIPRGEWVCLELGMRINTVGASDGEMWFWMNDTPGHQRAGISWRDVPELGLNKAWLKHYLDSDDATHPNRAWFDDVVVSTARIGCDSAPPSDPDAGPTPPTIDSGVPTADANPDPTADAATDPAADGGGSTNPGTDNPSLSGGCGCQSAEPSGGAPASLWLWLWLLLLLCPALRRRGHSPGS